MLIFMPGILRYAVGVLLVISFAFTSRKIYLGGEAMMDYFFYGIQSDIKLFFVFPILCAIFG